jgi:hypothetical protein
MFAYNCVFIEVRAQARLKISRDRVYVRIVCETRPDAAKIAFFLRLAALRSRNASERVNFCVSCLHGQCSADVNANDKEQFTPLHVFVCNSTGFNETILQLLCDAGAHFDYANQSGETAIDIASNEYIEQLLKARWTSSLKCLCARLIQKSKISYRGKISSSLVTFVERH